jgi:ATP/maltotriose-dependent transcriptional regulator MalT
MDYPLLTTKFFVPTPLPDQVRRSHLVEKLAEGLRPGCRLVLVSAPKLAQPVPSLVEPFRNRELEMLRLLAEGVSNEGIAALCFISVNTVKKHITNLYGKLGVSNRLQTVEKARVPGFLGPLPKAFA